MSRMRSVGPSTRAAAAVAMASAMVLSSPARAGEAMQIDAGALRTVQLGEMGRPDAPPRVLLTFRTPKDHGAARYGIACARAPKADEVAQCAVIDAAGAIVDTTIALNAIRVKAKGKKKGGLELLFRVDLGKASVHVEALAPMTTESIDRLQAAFSADLSALEFMTPDQAFPIGIPLGAEVRAEGDTLVFGDAGSVSKAELARELGAAPPALPEPAAPEPEPADEAG